MEIKVKHLEKTFNREDGQLSLEWNDSLHCVKISAPIEVIDPGNGIRSIGATGKPSQSHFQFLSYDKDSDTSLISCRPITG